MAQPPISRLDRDLLWNIFLFNTAGYPSISSSYPLPPSDLLLSPLMITRQTSQVCGFWRSIILKSPSIWGNCLDLDLLSQDHDHWRNEILQRTGSAQLAVYGRRPLMKGKVEGVQKFAMDVIYNHWARIKVLVIVIDSDEFIHDVRIYNALCRPAESLKTFFIRNLNVWDTEDSDFSFLLNSQLFANNAPLLTYFSITGFDFSTSNLLSIPAVLCTGLLRHLTLHSMLKISTLQLLAACMQMPFLESLRIDADNLIVETPRSPPSKLPLHPINLPELRQISITTLCLDIYPYFLCRINPRPGCRWNIQTTIQLRPEDDNTKLPIYAEEINSSTMRYMTSFFANHIPEHSSTCLALVLCQDGLSLVGYRVDDPELESPDDIYFQTVLEGSPTDIPMVIRETVARKWLSFNYPSYFTHFRFVAPDDDFLSHMSVTPIFLTLKSVGTLYTNLLGLSYICAQSEAAGYLFFPSLKTLSLMESGSFETTGQILKTFFRQRQSTAPIEVLDLREVDTICDLGNLRFLDQIAGLKVVWKINDQDSETMEYFCGSGTPSRLVFNT